jgi:hypothetical protein
VVVGSVVTALRTPGQRFTPYAVRLRQIATALHQYAPSDASKELRDTCRALESATRGEGLRMVRTLVNAARSELADLADVGPVTRAGKLDAEEALNRLAGMIGKGDPSPLPPTS